MRITKHFNLDEFTHSNTATIKNIKNDIDDIQHLFNIYYLSLVLEKIREHFNKPIIITSGYRNEKLNKLIGGVKNSQHTLGQAVDFHIKDTDLKEVFVWIIENIIFDQVILEKYNKNNNTGWIHLSYIKDGYNRRQSLTFDGKSYKTYKQV